MKNMIRLIIAALVLLTLSATFGVAKAQTSTVDIIFRYGDGAGVGAGVSAKLEQGNTVYFATTNAVSTAHFTDIPAGEYTARAYPPNDLTGSWECKGTVSVPLSAPAQVKCVHTNWAAKIFLPLIEAIKAILP